MLPRSPKTILAALAALALHSPSAADAAVVVSTTKSDSATIAISGTDLAQTQYSSSASDSGDAVGTRHAELFNGTTGSQGDGTGSTSVVRMSPGDSVTVTLDTSVHTKGYDITGIDTYFGWDTASGGRSNQGYEIILGFVDGGSSTLVSKQSWEPNAPASYWTQVSFRESGGGTLFSDTVDLNGAGAATGNSTLASGVESITISNVDAANPGNVVIAREIDVIGTPTTKPIASFSGSPSVVSPNAPVTFTWEFDPATSEASIDGGVGDILPISTNGMGSVTLDPGPNETTTYTLSATTGGQVSTAQVTIEVDINPVIYAFEADQTSVSQGTDVTLTWTVDNTTSLALNGVDVTGLTSTTVSPASNTIFTLTAFNGNGSTSATEGVRVIVPGQPELSEFLASNDDGLVDEYGETSDWIELHNPGTIPASLNGYYLTDDPAALTKWAFPDVTIAPGGYLIVFASGRDQATAGSELHTNFGLGAGGEYLALIAPDGVTVVSAFAPAYPGQQDDVSYGFDDSSFQHGFFLDPTPGAANTVGFIDFVADTTFSVDRGFYEEPISVAISTSTPDAEIRYTTNGMSPTATTGEVYSGEITISETTVLRAAAFKDGYVPTNVDTHTYLFPSDIVGQSAMDTTITEDPVYGPQMEDALRAVPTISLVFLGNPEHDIEKEASIELINFEAGNTQLDAGMERFGNRNTNFTKRSIRLNFRKIYGPGKLKFPIYEGHEYVTDPADEIDSIELRSGGHDMRQRGAYMSNRFADDTMLDMGNIAPHGRFVHVYINGTYWGQYHLRERWNAAMLSEYFGGDKDDYEAVNANDNFQQDLTVYDGSGDQWAETESLAAGPEPFANASSHVDMANIIDFMLLYATGNCESEFRSAGSPLLGVPFKFFMKDADGWLRDNNNGSRHQVTDDGPLDLRRELHEEGDPNYRILVADRIHKHYFNDGAFTPSQNINRLQERIDEIQLSFICESARWGERTPESWQSYQDDIIDNLFPDLTADMIGRYKAAGMYPNTVAPSFNQHGGEVAPGFQLAMTAPAGTIYYTLDGSDPRTPSQPAGPGAPPVTLLAESAAKTVHVPTSATDGFTDTSGTHWTAENYDDSSWTAGTGGVGFEQDEGYESYFATDVGPEMHDQSPSCLIRIPFIIAAGALDGMNSATLRARFDDGYVAYLNGTEVARENFTGGTPDGDSAASSNHGDDDAILLQSADISSHFGLLVEGANLLAIHGLNRSEGSSDFLISPQLDISDAAGNSGMVSPSAIAYTDTVPISSATFVRSRVFDGTAWSAINEAAFSQSLAGLVVSEFMYNPAAPTPAEIAAGFEDNDDFEYLELLNTGASTLDLTGVRFVEGITFDFTGSSITSLPSGGRVLIVEDLEAFNFRYGSGLPVAGEYEGKLDNSGEPLGYIDSVGEAVRTFTYGDSSPWPTAADGTGSALTLLSPNSIPDHDLAGSWTASNTMGGSPGNSGSAAQSYGSWAGSTGAGAPGDDSDDDGLSDLAELGLGGDPRVASTGALPSPDIRELTVGQAADQYLTITFTHPTNVSGLSIGAQASTDLDTWQPAVLHHTAYHGDGTATSTYRSAAPLAAQVRCFVRACFEVVIP